MGSAAATSYGSAMLDRLADDVWVASVPHKFLGLHLGTRMTVVRLAAGDLWVHSPIRLTPELRQEVDALGVVGHVVAPSLFHHLWAGEWASAYPDAKVYGPAALRKKREDLVLAAPLEEASRATWAGELAPLHIDGCMLDETVFVHGPSRTLVSSDLTENFESSPHWGTRMYLKAAGLHGKIGFSKALRMVFRDRRAARRSIDQLLERDFDRVILAHGDVILRDGKEAMRATYEFLA
jgi:hypothetical protein